jgi:nicotinic acid mononucleotide adenylyltransferase
MGSDSFQDVIKWRDFGRILTEYDVIVATRPGYPSGKEPTREEMIAHLPVEIQVRVIDLRDGVRPAPAITRSRHIYLTDYVRVDVSATDVRRAAAEGRSLVGIVPTRVADYIHKYGLYQNQL